MHGLHRRVTRVVSSDACILTSDPGGLADFPQMLPFLARVLGQPPQLLCVVAGGLRRVGPDVVLGHVDLMTKLSAERVLAVDDAKERHDNGDHEEDVNESSK